MIDWNNNGKIDPDDIVLTEVILGEEDSDQELDLNMDQNDLQESQGTDSDAEQGGLQDQQGQYRGGDAGCLTSMLLMIAVPVAVLAVLLV